MSNLTDSQAFIAGILIGCIIAFALVGMCHADEHTGATVGIVPTGEPETSRVPPSPSTIPLADRARNWVRTRPDGPFRARARGFDEDVSTAVLAAQNAHASIASAGGTFPSPELLLALAWRESRLRPGATGALGEVGLTQLHPRWVSRQERARLADPEVNMLVAAKLLATALLMCGSEGRALRRFATGECARPGYPERTIMEWARQIGEAR